MDNTPTIDAYRAFSRLKTLADETHTAHARIELARSMRQVARYVVDDRDRQAMLVIASEVEQITKSEIEFGDANGQSINQ